MRLPFLSGSGDYVPFGEDPVGYVKAMWVPWLLAGLPLAAFVARLTESTLREQLQEDYVRTARAKGAARAARSSTATRCRSPPRRSPR